MPKILNWKTLLAGLILIIAIYGAYSYWNQVPTYADVFYKNLTVGDITSTQCGQLGKDMQNRQAEETLSSPGLVGVFDPRLEYYDYLYNKHRCIGETTIALNGNSKDVLSHTDSIIDLSTGATLVSCTVDYTETKNPIVRCADDDNSWRLSEQNAGSKEWRSSPYPIFSSTYLSVVKLGGQ